MTNLWVVDSSPLIVLGKAGQLELLAKLAEKLVVPAAVIREVTVRREEALLMEFLETLSPLQIEPNCEVCPEVLAWALGSGESQVISIAARLGVARAVLDDLEARRCAKSMNIRVIGSLGVVVKAKQMGLIPKAKPIIERLRLVGLYLNDAIVNRALAQAGEK